MMEGGGASTGDGFVWADQIALKNSDEQLERHLSRVWALEKKKESSVRQREDWEIDTAKLVIKGLIARGTFGTVHRGVYDSHDVAESILSKIELDRCKTWIVNRPSQRRIWIVAKHHCGIYFFDEITQVKSNKDPKINLEHVPHMLKKCHEDIPDLKMAQYVRNDCGIPMVLDNNYRNILNNKGLLGVNHQLPTTS